MNLDFCICNKEDIPSLTHLDVIFRVWGTSAYKVPRKKIISGKYYFVYTTRGEGTISYDNETVEITQDHVILLQPSSNFSYECNNDIWEFWWFEFFSLPETTNLLKINQLIPTRLTSFQSTILDHSLRYAKEGHWNISETLFLSLYEMVSLNELRRSTSSQNLLLDSIEQYISVHFRQLQVNDVCQFFQISNRALYNLFQMRHSCSPKQYIDRIRLENAKQLLLNSTLSIAAISEQLGYANPFHFSKRFHQYFELSPSKFRQISR